MSISLRIVIIPARTFLYTLLLVAFPCTLGIAQTEVSTYFLTNLTAADAASQELVKQCSSLAAGGIPAPQLSAMQASCLKLHHSYEAARALVAGIPELSGYDGILETGLKPVSLTIGKQSPVKNPGGLLVAVLEPALWSQDDRFTLQGQTYSRSDVIVSTANEIRNQLGLLLTAAQAWKPSPENCRSALATSIQLVPTYFDDWQQSQYGDPPSGLYKAGSRLDDLKSFLAGVHVLFTSFASRGTDKSLATDPVSSSLSSLDDLVNLSIQRAAVGQFSPANAGEPSQEAQRLATDLHEKLSRPGGRD